MQDRNETRAGDTPTHHTAKRSVRTTKAPATPSSANTTPHTTLPAWWKNFHWAEKLLDWTWYGLALLMPLFFLPTTSEAIELNKHALLVGATGIIVALYMIRFFTGRRVEIRGNLIYWGVGAVVLAWIAATFTSRYWYQSFLGIEGQEYTSLISIICFALLAKVGGSYLNTEKIIRLINTLIISSGIATLIGLLQMTGNFLLPFGFTKTNAFNTVGILSAWGALATTNLVLVVARLIHISAQSLKERTSKILFPLIAGIDLFALIALDDKGLWYALLAGLVISLVVLLIKLPKDKRISWLAVPSFLIVVAIVMSIVDIQRPLISPPLEAYPNTKITKEVVWGTVKESPLTGYGPGTFAMSYSQHRGTELNNLNLLSFWQARFDQGMSALLTTVAGVGVLGVGAILALLVLIALKLFATLKTTELSDRYLLLMSLTGALTTLGTLYILKPTNLTISFVAWLVITCIIALSSKSLTVLNNNKNNHHLIGASFIASLIVLCGIGGMYIFFANRYVADMTYAQALMQDAKIAQAKREGKTPEVKDVDTLITTLNDAYQQSIVKQSGNTSYVRAMSQALLYRFGQVSTDKNASRDVVATVANDATESAKRAVSLNPHDGRNLLNLASVYETLIPFDGTPEQQAASLAIEQLTRAAEREPANPLVHLSMGRTYLALAGAQRQLAQNIALKDDKGADIAGAAAQQEKLNNDANAAIEKAGAALDKAITLKADLAPAHFQKAVIAFNHNDKDAARASLDKAAQANIGLITYNAADASLFYSIGLGYNTLEDLDSADRAFALAVQTANGQYPLAWWQRLVIAQQKGRTADAITIAKHLLEGDPENQIIKDKLAELEATPTK